MQEQYLKKEPIDFVISPIKKFIQNEISGSIVLFTCAIIAMVLANSPLSSHYESFWHQKVSLGFGKYILSQDLHHWVNDGLMSVFFFVIGLEIKREVIGGELSSIRKAALPFAAGLGGMLIPALLFFLLNQGTDGQNGWGIPMATDIAFALGLLALLGKNVPLSLKIFLTALAIADDLGAVIVIAVFYTEQIHWHVLGIGGIIFTSLIAINIMGVRNSFVYALLGIGGLWLAFLLSGVHATLAGVLAAFTIPAKTKINQQYFSTKMSFLVNAFSHTTVSENKLVTYEQLRLLDTMKKHVSQSETPLQRLEHSMHKLVLYFIMPVFALANAGITINSELLSYFTSPVTVGVMLGLIAGKFFGIVLFVKLIVKLNWASLPLNCNWFHIYGVALLAGVGFTMSLFVTKLAYIDETLVLQAKLGVISASIIAGIGGILLLKLAIKKQLKADLN